MHYTHRILKLKNSKQVERLRRPDKANSDNYIMENFDKVLVIENSNEVLAMENSDKVLNSMCKIMVICLALSNERRIKLVILRALMSRSMFPVLRRSLMTVIGKEKESSQSSLEVVMREAESSDEELFDEGKRDNNAREGSRGKVLDIVDSDAKGYPIIIIINNFTKPREKHKKNSTQSSQHDSSSFENS